MGKRASELGNFPEDVERSKSPRKPSSTGYVDVAQQMQRSETAAKQSGQARSGHQIICCCSISLHSFSPGLIVVVPWEKMDEVHKRSGNSRERSAPNVNIETLSQHPENKEKSCGAGMTKRPTKRRERWVRLLDRRRRGWIGEAKGPD